MEHPDDRRIRKAYEWLDTKLPWLVDVKDFVIRIVTWVVTWVVVAVTSVVDRIGVLLFIVLAVVIGNWTTLEIDTRLGEQPSSDSVSDSSGYGESDTADNRNCNVIGIEIRGCVLTYRPDSADNLLGSSDSCDTITSSENVVAAIQDAKKDSKIKAVLLEIDSGGGVPVAAEEVADALKWLEKPSIAWIRGTGASTAYWIASAADTIIAAQNSDIGSIGVTSSYVDNVKENQTKGLTYNQLNTGLYKDTGDPDKPLTVDERALIQRDLNIILNNFIRAVATNRNLSIEKVRALADGSSMLGAMALKNGLIDQLGTQRDVVEALEKQIGKKPEICWK